MAPRSPSESSLVSSGSDGSGASSVGPETSTGSVGATSVSVDYRGVIAGDAAVTAPLLEMVGNEIERMRAAEKAERHEREHNDPQGQQQNNHNHHPLVYHTFPPACLRLLHGLEGNGRCVDCGQPGPQWAAVSYGALLCLQCSGRHRSLGVQVSCVRSIRMDEWSLEQVLTMLEGGKFSFSR